MRGGFLRRLSGLSRLVVVALGFTGLLASASAGAPPPSTTGPPGTVLGTPSSVGVESIVSGFQDSVVFTGLSQPTVVRFAPDGRLSPLASLVKTTERQVLVLSFRRE